MQLTQDNNQGLNIHAVTDNEISIGEKNYTQSILLSNAEIHDWPVDINDFQAKDIALIEQQKPEIFIIGTGTKRINLSGEWQIQLMNKGIGVEIMDTAAACRTFNILSADNRSVMAGLIIG